MHSRKFLLLTGSVIVDRLNGIGFLLLYLIVLNFDEWSERFVAFPLSHAGGRPQGISFFTEQFSFMILFS